MIVLGVDGMTCGGCERAVAAAIAAVDPAAKVTVDRASGRVVVETTLAPDHAVAAVEAAGYEARLVSGG